MCTYITTTIPVRGSGKAPSGWIPLRHAAVYVDHPVHAPFGHTVNIDFANPELGPSARVAVELTEQDALALIEAIRAALAAAPPGLAAAPDDAAEQAATGAAAPVEGSDNGLRHAD